MYYDYFGFNQPPFKITPDTKLFYSGGDRGAILDALVYAILNGEGIVKVVGEVGSGKTMLCRMLEKELPDNVEVVYLVNPSISPENTLHAIAFELKLGINAGTSRFEVMNQLQKYLLQRHSENCQVVVFVEEAQSMPIATLEEIRLLSNLETQQSKLLQIVLFGQPELDVMIAQPEIRQLKERITYSFQLSPFKTNDIREYINTRVRACGYRAGELFDDAALKQIEHYSKGLLRRINILADKSLLAAFAENNHKVTGKHARLAARDSEFVSPIPWHNRTAVMTTGISLAILVLIAIYILFILPQKQAEIAEMVSSMPAITENDRELQQTEPDSSVVSADTVVTVETESDFTTGNADNTGQPDDQELPVESHEIAATTEHNQIFVNVDTDITAETAMNNVAEQGQQPLHSQISDPDVANDDTGQPQQTVSVTPINDNNQLLGMSVVYPLIDLSDSRLNDDETRQLQRQFQKLPPESAEYLSLDHDRCEQCWSLIYRPVWPTEKL